MFSKHDLVPDTRLEVRFAYKDGMPISPILPLQFKDTPYCKYRCSDARFDSFGLVLVADNRSCEISDHV